MVCPVCLHADTKVLDSRVSSDGLTIRRRRECQKCNFRFSTLEAMEILDLAVIKRDGQKQAYSREKMAKGLNRALEKRPISDDKYQKLLNKIESEIQAQKSSNEITSQKIGLIIMRHLRRTDPIAFIRFASVYQQFEDIDTFYEEISKLIKPRKKK
jgi:transcriptional repressor NrdR